MARDADIRRRQLFESFKGAFAQLTGAVELARQRPLSGLEQQGLIHVFDFTHELAWNVLEDYLQEQGFVGIVGPKDASLEAFRNGLVEDGDTWMEMIKARNLTTNTYDRDVAEAIAKDVLESFAPAFAAFERKFDELAEAE